jgi:hypothetical protein
MSREKIANFKCSFCAETPGCVLHDLPEAPDARLKELKLQDTTTLSQMEARVRVCDRKQKLKEALNADT